MKVNQPSARPTRKVAASLSTGAIATVIASVARQYFGVEIPFDVAMGAATLLSFAVSYFTRNEAL